MPADESATLPMVSPVVVNSTKKESLWRLGGLTPVQLGWRVFEQVITDNVFGRAAELAFYFLFALFPMILLMMTLFGMFASHRAELERDLLASFGEFLPPAAFQLLGSVAEELAAHASNGKLTFGIVTALWGISGGVSAMISALDAAYKVRETRSWIRVRAIAIGLSVAISILLFSAVFMVSVGSHFVGWLGRGLGLHPLIVTAWKAIQWPGAIFFVTLACGLVYYYGPDLEERRKWHWFTPGAAFGALVWVATSFGFRTYLYYFNNYSVSYGSLGAVMVLLAWLYLAGLAYLIGGEINAVIERCKGG